MTEKSGQNMRPVVESSYLHVKSGFKNQIEVETFFVEGITREVVTESTGAK